MEEKVSASLTKYIIGFVFSVLLTLLAYTIVTQHLVAPGNVILAIMGLAVAQFIIQLVCFLHIGSGTRSRLNLWALIFMLFVLVVIVGGSLWVMYHLNYTMMTPHQMDQYMIKQGGKGF